MNQELEDFKEQVRHAADIVEVISSYVGLKKRGRNFWGCCPFHGEKTPSFAVNSQKQMFYCFGCHEGGDVFRFIMRSENCGFMDAAKLLANRYGIPVPEREKSSKEIAWEQKSKAVYEANELAGKYFQACLLKTAHGGPALEYLAGRGITEEIINSFAIGYALNRFDGLLVSLGRRGLSQDLLVEAGLVVKGDRGAYDKFCHRVMIPIKDHRGRIVGFGGRVLDAAAPKYLNTGETAWFNKRRLLFGLNLALPDIKASNQVVIVEGYMDAISLHAAGLKNVVASMGTAFAAEQARLLQKLQPQVIFCYDSDAAGRRASVRAVSVAREAGLKVKVALVPQGKDPDEYVRSQGLEAYKKVLEQAKEGINFQIDETIAQIDTNTLAGKVAAVSNIIPFLLECKNQIEVAEHMRMLAHKLTIDEGLIIDEYGKATRKGGGSREPEPRASVPQEGKTAQDQAEALILGAFLNNSDLVYEYQNRVEEIGFTNKDHQAIYSCILEQLVQEGVLDLGKLQGALAQEHMPALAAIMAEEVVAASYEQLMEDCLRQLKRLFLEKEYLRHSALAAQYERANDSRMFDELRESQRIKDDITKLYGK